MCHLFQQGNKLLIKRIQLASRRHGMCSLKQVHQNHLALSNISLQLRFLFFCFRNPRVFFVNIQCYSFSLLSILSIQKPVLSPNQCNNDSEKVLHKCPDAYTYKCLFKQNNIHLHNLLLTPTCDLVLMAQNQRTSEASLQATCQGHYYQGMAWKHHSPKEL